MAKPKKQINFFVETELWREFSKKCIDEDKSKTEVLIGLVKRFIN